MPWCLIHDMTEALCVRAALDVAEHAAVVADSWGRVLAFNKPAAALFSGRSRGRGVAPAAAVRLGGRVVGSKVTERARSQDACDSHLRRCTT